MNGTKKKMNKNKGKYDSNDRMTRRLGAAYTFQRMRGTLLCASSFEEEEEKKEMFIIYSTTVQSMRCH